ncbi:hypothetical protein [Alkalimonas amylolytica]|uniref:Uncharacterized protein n=1 Tax=Alkalimonas amylolytica TaxID=152573 RepID=A0A1H3XMD2_ALKAM|nr:hypothetical protein [Alkalimonas amylolytica]SDZ99774.1 hypothetical protein SAMN04488051_101282 [Alkalimonas amylolytica]
MNKALLLAAGTLSCLLLAWWLWPSAASAPAAAANTPAAITKPSQAASPVAVAHPLPIQAEPEQAPMQQQLQWLASAYADEIAIPAYSRPLTTADSQLLEPNRFIAQPVPLKHGASVSLFPSQYRFIYPEPIHIKLQLQGVSAQGATLRLLHEWTGEQLAEQAMQPAQDGFQLQLSSQQSWDGSVTAEVQLHGSTEPLLLRTGFEISAPVAHITGIASSYGEGPDMVIPVQLQAELAGHYRLRANLLTAGRQPIAVLTARAELPSGNTTLQLRAHRSVLPDTDEPFWLTTFQLERLSPAPGQPTRYGDSAEPEFLLEPFSLHQLSNDPYRADEQEQQRLRLLQQLAQ